MPFTNGETVSCGTGTMPVYWWDPFYMMCWGLSRDTKRSGADVAFSPLLSFVTRVSNQTVPMLFKVFIWLQPRTCGPRKNSRTWRSYCRASADQEFGGIDSVGPLSFWVSLSISSLSLSRLYLLLVWEQGSTEDWRSQLWDVKNGWLCMQLSYLVLILGCVLYRCALCHYKGAQPFDIGVHRCPLTAYKCSMRPPEPRVERKPGQLSASSSSTGSTVSDVWKELRLSRFVSWRCA